ncbi:YodL domain-containing protein [Peribacillus alkalitolerans]|uniref:YodL domain-containing protein n=1 Tax=Peribacillus alkalitolerans TaxID=1550385 RepID=UPI001F0803A0|nr:YodL domain-containing protein [Peribacillus alkalitolerans]
MLKGLVKRKTLETDCFFDITIFQTNAYGQKRGYQQVYRLNVEADSHTEAIEAVFGKFNVADRIPKDYQARYITTGDIVLIDEGIKGKTYYKLCIGGWKIIHRLHVC